MTTAELAARALSARARSRALVVAIPAWAWLGGLVTVSAVVRYLLARNDPGPWIFVDELIYSELAKSFVSEGTLAVREVATTGYGFVYPVLISPAYALFDAIPQVHAAIKAINAVLMSLAAVPAYVLARCLLPRDLSLLAAALALAIPSMAFTSTVMTENAFYPAFLLSALAIVLALERPTALRQLAVLATIAVAFLTRAQAVALVPALVVAIALFAVLDTRANGERLVSRALARRLGSFSITWLALGGGAVALGLYQLSRGRSLSDFLGAYETVAHGGRYSLAGVSRWFLYHVAELDLWLGILPFASFGVLAAAAVARSESRSLRAFVSASVPLVFFLTLVVAAFASQTGNNRIEERNLFYVGPLFLIALVWWVDRGLPRPARALAVAAVLSVALPGVLPYADFINVSATSDTLGLLPLWGLQERLVAPAHLPAVIMLVAIGAGVLLLALPRRLALVLPALVLAYFAAAASPVEHRIQRTSAGTVFEGIHVERDWIDRTVGSDARVAVVWSAAPSIFAVWENEFFNRSVGPVYNLGSPLPGNLPETPLVPDPATGALLDPGGRPVLADFALTDTSVGLEGVPVAQDPGRGMVLYRVEGQLTIGQRVSGLYVDTWSGPELTYTRLGCRSGILSVLVSSDPGLFQATQTITAYAGERELARVSIEPDSAKELQVPLAPLDGRCDVRFTVSPTAVPAQVLPGSGDTRELGAHFTGFTYEPTGSEAAVGD